MISCADVLAVWPITHHSLSPLTVLPSVICTVWPSLEARAVELLGKLGKVTKVSQLPKLCMKFALIAVFSLSLITPSVHTRGGDWANVASVCVGPGFTLPGSYSSNISFLFLSSSLSALLGFWTFVSLPLPLSALVKISNSLTFFCTPPSPPPSH